MRRDFFSPPTNASRSSSPTARGSYVFDSTGKKYLDFLGGIAVNGLGHAHPNIVKVIRRESARAIHLSNLFHNEFQGPLAKKLAEISGMDRVFFSNSGTEAIEGCLKLARLYSRPPMRRSLRRIPSTAFSRSKILFTAAPSAPSASPPPKSIGYPSLRSSRESNSSNSTTSPTSNPSSTKTFAPSSSRLSRVKVASTPSAKRFWNRARALTQNHDALLVADEIQCGLGRTGRYFAYQNFSSKPDLVAIAKPLAAGLPLGAILTSEAVAARVSPAFMAQPSAAAP